MDTTESDKDIVDNITSSDIESTHEALQDLQEPVRTDVEDRLCFPEDTVHEEGGSSKTDFVSSILDDTYNQDDAISSNEVAPTPLDPSESTDLSSKSSDILESNLLQYESENTEISKNDEMEVDDSNPVSDQLTKTTEDSDIPKEKEDVDIQNETEDSKVQNEKDFDVPNETNESAEESEKPAEVMEIDDEVKSEEPTTNIDEGKSEEPMANIDEGKSEEPTTNIDETNECVESASAEITVEDVTTSEDTPMEAIDNVDSAAANEAVSEIESEVTESSIDVDNREVMEADTPAQNKPDEQTDISEDQSKSVQSTEESEKMETELLKSPISENKEDNSDEVHTTDVSSSNMNQSDNPDNSSQEIEEICESTPTTEDQPETECSSKEAEKTPDESVQNAEQVTEITTLSSASSTSVCNNIDQTNSEDVGDSNPVFEHVVTENGKSAVDKAVPERSSTDNQEEEDFQVTQPQEDPIGSDNFAPVAMEEDTEETEQSVDEQDDEQGASEEMCIIPDTERIISQAEKDAAAAMVPLRDPTDSEFFSSDPSSDGQSGENAADKRKSNPENYVVSLCVDENVNLCMQCCLPRKSKYSILHQKVTTYICDDGCLNNFKRRHNDKIVMNNERDLRVKKLTSGINNDNMVAKVKFSRKCAQCQKRISMTQLHLTWETMEYCNERCLSKYQKKIASNCSNCNVSVRNNCLGKYCVRFGYNIRQFCSSICLEEYKKGLKVCSYCQKDMSTGGGDGFLAPVGDKGQFKDFCTQLCMEKYDIMSNNRSRQVRKSGSICSVCSKEKPITIEFEHNSKMNLFCGEPCFVAFKFVNNITPAKCDMCKKYFDNKILEENSMFYDNSLHSFCSKSCQNIYIIRHRKIIPCNWCKVKKYNFDMIQRSSAAGATLIMCSLNCLSLYRVSVNAVQSKKSSCDHCHKTLQPLYHLTMSDATMRNFCSYPCVMAFQSQFPKTPITLNEPEETAVPVPTGGPKRTRKATAAKQPEPVPADVPTIPVISSVQSLATTNGPSTSPLGTPRSNNSIDSSQTPSPPIVKTQIKQHFIIKPSPIPPQRNIGTLCKVNTQTKGVHCKPNTCNAEVQTDEIKEKTAIIPIPIPIYVPAPMWMYSMPFPVPFPFPLPVPVPIFIPTTRNSANGIMKEIKKIQVKIPTDPFEAELLMMAEMVAGDKKEEHTDSESEEEEPPPPPEETTFSPEPVDASNTFGDDMLQMALKMATELDEPAVDLEGALTANTITASQGTEPPVVEEPPEETPPIHQIMERQSMRGRKRPGRPPKTAVTPSKRGRRSSSQMEIPIMPPPQPPPPQEPVEKPDANMCLKYTFGVNAWKQWVTTKNAELEKSSRRVKLFKPEILQLTADELNYSLCLFVKEVRKPNGQEYAPDTIYYLCLGIQQYLFENARIDNIFCDSYYEKFTDCLDEVAKKFSVLYNDSHYIVTRVEEEHLWESKQLGAHSPHVLLSTLMFFNTKHFNLTTVDEHMQLSFSHIMKHWKRNPNQPGTAKVAGSRNVLLRFYPPQTNNTDTTQRKKKVYEQQENEENPLRCPVKLYEFYLSKCPESVKTRNDVFYLLPERSCVPDSPVWYSTMPLPRAALEKMLHRVKMVKEINVALLTS